MAKFIKFNLTTAGAGGDELLIEVADVLRNVQQQAQLLQMYS